MSNDPITQTIDRALRAAGLTTKTGVLKNVVGTIERALAAAGLQRTRAPLPDPAPPVFRPRRSTLPEAPVDDSPATDAGRFLLRSHAIGQAQRTYKLYVPSSYRGDPAPLILMLHGCKQNPDDFAAGTRMNELAERSGFLVAYPAQTARENGSHCWNWFERPQQVREGIEPALLAGIVGDVGDTFAVDASRVFVAGLSAGAAMAVILGASYPDVFKGVAAHSGLPLGAAHDVPSAFAAMQGRAAAPTLHLPAAVPTIVFHGDADTTVSLANGASIVEQAVRSFAGADTRLHKRPDSPSALQGRTVSTTRYADADGRSRVESWVVHGGSHAWFGGSARGSYTDPAGPDASAEIVRFFLGQTT